jgi:hypothetical protein
MVCCDAMEQPLASACCLLSLFLDTENGASFALPISVKFNQIKLEQLLIIKFTSVLDFVHHPEPQ